MSEAVLSSSDPGRVELAGLQLIEAAAGTGKTWTIASLVLRLLLEKRIPIGRILVVSFTRAATAELASRIRARLDEALRAFVAGTSEEPFLARLVAEHSAAEARLSLRLALASFDEAAILTIHGFCQRALRESAFAAGRHFERELTADDGLWLAAVARDFWRKEMARASSAWAAWLMRRYRQGPDEVAGWLKSILTHADTAVLALPPEEDGQAVEEAFGAAFATARETWRRGREEILAPLASDGMSKTSYSPKAVTAAAELFDRWLASPQPVLPGWSEEEWKKAKLLTPERLRLGTKKGGEPPVHPFYEQCETLLAAGMRLEETFAQRMRRVFGEFARAAKREMRARRARAGLQGYDDLIDDLAAALAGEQGGRLAQDLRARFHAALVDEFQDTDARQLTIFRRLFGDAERPLILVGDPKQAIYGFRGADVYAYLTARQAASRHSLLYNRRSDEALLLGINRLFEHPRPFLLAEIPFAPALPANSQRSPCRIEDGAPTPLLLWSFPPPAEKTAWSKEEALGQVAAAVAEDIVRLLRLAREGRAWLGDRRLAANDIAVLVRTRRQAQAIGAALAQRGLASANLGGGSVWQSDEADEFARLMAALIDPLHLGRLKAALATRLYGWTATAIAALADDQRLLAACLEKFHDDRRRLEQEGFLAMWRRLAWRENIYARLLRQPQGERRLTNYRHLAELIGEAARQRFLDAEGILRLLLARRADGGGEEAHLRLDSDAHLVRIATIHAAKGLQYPIVYCPFLWHVREEDEREWPVLAHEEGALCLDFGSDRFAVRARQARLETAAEELRLAYVALTRAQHRLIVPWIRANGAERSPLAWLLFGRDACAAETREGDDPRAMLFEAWPFPDEAQRLTAFAAATPFAIAVMPPPNGGAASWEGGEEEAERGAPRSFRGKIPAPWSVLSFSSLAGQMVGREEADHDPCFGASVPTESRGIHAFPRGARAGSCLHRLFERCDFQQLEAAPQIAAEALAEFGFEQLWQPVLIDLVGAVTQAALPGTRFRLAEVPRLARLTEMEFTFPLGHPAARAGYMKGFIDLVFHHEGRWYIVDYKSNWLGPSFADYTPERLQQAMRAHRYDLQARIYAAALYRMLRLRQSDFDWESSFGGVFYLFVRGMMADSSCGIVSLHPSRDELEEFLA